MASTELIRQEMKRHKELYETIIGNRDDRIKSLKAEIEILERDRRRQKLVSVRLEKENRSAHAEVQSLAAAIGDIRDQVAAFEEAMERRESHFHNTSHQSSFELTRAVSDIQLFILPKRPNEDSPTTHSQGQKSETILNSQENVDSSSHKLVENGDGPSERRDADSQTEAQLDEFTPVIALACQSGESGTDQIPYNNFLKLHPYQHVLLFMQTGWYSFDHLNQALYHFAMLVEQLGTVVRSISRSTCHLGLVWLLDIPNICTDCSYLLSGKVTPFDLPPAAKASLIYGQALLISLLANYVVCWSLICFLGFFIDGVSNALIYALGLTLNLFVCVPYLTSEYRLKKGIVIALPVNDITYKDLTRISSFLNAAFDNPFARAQTAFNHSFWKDLRPRQESLISLLFAGLMLFKVWKILSKNILTRSTNEPLPQWITSAAESLENLHRHAMTHKQRFDHCLRGHFRRLSFHFEDQLCLTNVVFELPDSSEAAPRSQSDASNIVESSDLVSQCCSDGSDNDLKSVPTVAEKVWPSELCYELQNQVYE